MKGGARNEPLALAFRQPFGRPEGKPVAQWPVRYGLPHLWPGDGQAARRAVEAIIQRVIHMPAARNSIEEEIMTDGLNYSNVLQQVQARFTWHAGPHRLADNDNDYPPAVPAQAMRVISRTFE